VDPRQNKFHCFACQAHGVVLRLVAAMERCSLCQAAGWLAERFGVESPGCGGAAARQNHDELGKQKRRGRRVRRGLLCRARIYRFAGDEEEARETLDTLGRDFSWRLSPKERPERRAILEDLLRELEPAPETGPGTLAGVRYL
jgi:DNA primase